MIGSQSEYSKIRINLMTTKRTTNTDMNETFSEKLPEQNVEAIKILS